jgi:hypothetical protein
MSYALEKGHESGAGRREGFRIFLTGHRGSSPAMVTVTVSSAGLQAKALFLLQAASTSPSSPTTPARAS